VAADERPARIHRRHHARLRGDGQGGRRPGGRRLAGVARRCAKPGPAPAPARPQRPAPAPGTCAPRPSTPARTRRRSSRTSQRQWGSPRRSRCCSCPCPRS
jgi:hypothetical protein